MKHTIYCAFTVGNFIDTVIIEHDYITMRHNSNKVWNEAETVYKIARYSLIKYNTLLIL